MSASNSYIYYSFGFKITSNYEIRGLEKNKNSDFPFIPLLINLKISLDFDDIENPYGITKNDNVYILCFKKITYHITKSSIKVTCNSEELFFSTLFNLPLSIVMTLNGRLLLHSSSFVHENTLYPICADKGNGKSTLSAYALTKGDTFFSDDTLPLILFNDCILAVNSVNYIKLNKDSADSIYNSRYNSYKKNIQGKIYIPTKYKFYSLPLNHIFFMVTNNKINHIQLISNFSTIKILLFKNIVGISWFDSSLKNLITESDIFKALYLNSLKFFSFNNSKTFISLNNVYEYIIANK